MKKSILILGALVSASAFAQETYLSLDYRSDRDQWNNNYRSAYFQDSDVWLERPWFQDVSYAYGRCQAYHWLINDLVKEGKTYKLVNINPLSKQIANIQGILDGRRARYESLTNRIESKTETIRSLEAEVKQMERQPSNPNRAAKIREKRDQISAKTEARKENEEDRSAIALETPSNGELNAQKAELVESRAVFQEGYLNKRKQVATAIDGHFLCHDMVCDNAADIAMKQETLKFRTLSVEEQKSRCRSDSSSPFLPPSNVCQYSGVVQARQLFCP